MIVANLHNPRKTAFTLAWDTILEKKGDATALQALQEMFQGDDCLEERQFTTLHKLILAMIHIDIKEYLLDCPQSVINQVDSDGRTALSWASARGDTGAVSTLLASNADPNIASNFHKSALHFAAVAGNVLIIDQLLLYGAKINAKDDLYGQIALHMACLARTPQSCLRLVEAGADIECRDEMGGGTPLIFACQSGDAGCVQILVESGANIESETFEAETAIFIAAQFSSHEVIRILLSRGANLARYNKDGLSILHCLAENGDLESLKLFTEVRIKGLRIDDEDSRGMTPAKLAERRTQEPPEWHAAWADLVASLDQTSIPESSNDQSIQTTELKPPSRSRSLRLILVCKTLLNTLRLFLMEEARQIHHYLAQLPRPPSAILRSTAILALLISWFLVSILK